MYRSFGLLCAATSACEKVFAITASSGFVRVVGTMCSLALGNSVYCISKQKETEVHEVREIMALRSLRC